MLILILLSFLASDSGTFYKGFSKQSRRESETRLSGQSCSIPRVMLIRNKSFKLWKEKHTKI